VKKKRRVFATLAGLALAVAAMAGVSSSAHAVSPPVITASAGTAASPAPASAAELAVIDSALTAHGFTAAQVQPAAATTWYGIWINSQHNGLCADGKNTDEHLSPIEMYKCDEGGDANNEWLCRILNPAPGWAWDQVGQHVECIDPSASYMFGESGGAFKMETISASDWIDIQAPYGLDYWQMVYVPDYNYWGAGPDDEPVGVESTETNGYGWTFCGAAYGCYGNGQPS
jgi:hypothetical protein